MSKQHEIIETLEVKAEIDSELEIRQRVNFLKEYLLAHPFLKSLVLGISGGQDSTLAGRLTQLAIEELRVATNDDAYQFIAIRLPYGSQADESDAQKALAFIQADQNLTVNIKPAVLETVKSLEASGQVISDFNKGNIKARQRMVVQYAVAGNNNGAVIGTDHAAENVTGFFTKFGDGGADVLPLAGLTKGQGKKLLQALGAEASLYEKIPTADLEENKPMIADEVALGVTYQEIDTYLEGGKVSVEAAATIENWYQKTEHKRHLPITPTDTFWKEK